ncbi:MAG: penicillin acylase family protein [Pseudomonadota bacterium]
MALGQRLAIVVAVFAGAALLFDQLIMAQIKDRQTSGSLELAALTAPVRVVRDDLGMPYIYAESLTDALRAQGFVAGQDRLFQLEVAKRAASGRLAEIFGAGTGDVILNLDREARVIGFHRLASRQLEVLSPEARQSLDAYLDGLNAYVATREATHPLEFKMAGFAPEAWTATDLLTLTFYLGWASSANFDAELIAHKVIGKIGKEAFEEIAPLTVNPDDSEPQRQSSKGQDGTYRWAGKADTPAPWTRGGWRQLGMGGSNNWAVSGAKAGTSAAIVTNDPHLDSRNLPGPWHPVGLITPEFRVVGVSTGLPGVVVGRNAHVAFGVTNAYADAVDLYIETVDPSDADRYLEGDQSLPFDALTEIIRIKDDEAGSGYREEELVVRSTRRGPVITDHDPERGQGAVISVRWAAAEYMGPELGLDGLMAARTIEEAIAAVETARIVSLNFVVGDVTGRVARRASGAAPIRLRGDGMSPFPITDGTDNWAGPIPASEMPGEIDPAAGWTGSANHMTAPSDYPYIYTTYASPAYRYRRVRELMNAPQVTAEEAWAAQYDTLNLFARDIAPIFVEALSEVEDEALRELAEILAAWDYQDEKDKLAPTLFHETVRQLAQLTYEDELGEDAVAAYLSNWYVWQQRFDALVQEGTSDLFDDTRTEEVEELPDMIRRAGKAALERLTDTHGPNRAAWTWGKVHQIHFSGPLRLDGMLGRLTGNQSVAMSGSGETLLRALYPFDEPFDSKWFASLRMTADLNDPDKVRAVLPGGAVGRTFHQHLDDQTKHWADEEPQTYWWFSDEAIEDNTRSVLTLTTSGG